jgi:hypothetical protein
LWKHQSRTLEDPMVPARMLISELIDDTVIIHALNGRDIKIRTSQNEIQSGRYPWSDEMQSLHYLPLSVEFHYTTQLSRRCGSHSEH